MHAAVCLLRAGQPRSADDAAELGQFIGQFSWVTGDPIGAKGLNIEQFSKNSDLYSTKCFLFSKKAPKSLATGAPPQTPLGELTALPQTP